MFYQLLRSQLPVVIVGTYKYLSNEWMDKRLCTSLSHRTVGGKRWEMRTLRLTEQKQLSQGHTESDRNQNLES